MRFRFFSLLAAIALMASVVRANAQLVANGGFELGNTGWSMNIGTCPTGTLVGNPATGPAFTGADGFQPRSGKRDMWFGAVSNEFPCTPNISQVLATVAGQTYNLDFWVRLTSLYTVNIPNFFQVLVGGNSLFSGQITSNPWQEMSFGFTSASGNDVLEFSAHNTPGGTQLDDVSVGVVPEPATMTMLVMGLVGMAGAGLRRRKKLVG